MPNDKEKLLRVMRCLDADYAHGKISEENTDIFALNMKISSIH